MTRIPIVLAALYSLCLSASAVDLSGKIQWNDVCPDLGSLGPSKVVLDGGSFAGSITQSGHFVIPGVPAGAHVLLVVSHDYVFDQLRIDVADTDSHIEVRPYIPGTSLNPPSTVLLSHPISLIPRLKHVYFVPPESFNLIGMFQNPMMLLMVFGGVMMLATPYLTKNLDPEAMKEYADNQAKIARMQSSFSNGDLKTGLSTLMSGGDSLAGPRPPTPSSSAKASVPSSNKNRGNRNKRR